MYHNKLIIENILVNNLNNLSKLHRSLHLYLSLAPFHRFNLKNYQEIHSFQTELTSKHIKAF